MRNFRLFGYNPTITTSTDPEDVWGGGGSYTFPPVGENPTTRDGVHISSTQDTDMGNVKGIDNMSTGAQTVRIYGLDKEYNELIIDTPIYGGNSYDTGYNIFRINHMEVISTGSDLKNNGNVHVGIGGVSSGVPVVRTYSTILADDLQTLSTIYTVPRGSILEIDSIDIELMAVVDITWSFHAGYGGALKKIITGFIDGSSSTKDSYIFKTPYKLEGPIDIKVKVDEVSGTTGVTAAVLGNLTTTTNTKEPVRNYSTENEIRTDTFSVRKSAEDIKREEISIKLQRNQTI